MDFSHKTLLATLEFPPQIGGVANYYYHLCEQFAPDKIFVLIDSKQPILSSQFKIFSKKFYHNFIYPHWLLLIWQIYKIAKKEKIELLWAGQVLPVGTACLVASKLLKIPYIVSTHGLDILGPQKNFRKNIILKFVLKHSQEITANSEFTKQELLKLGVSQDKITIILPKTKITAIAKQEVITNLKKTYNLEGKKILLTVARLVPRKGHELVLRALYELPQINNFVYLIVGDGPSKGTLESLVRELNLTDKVIFTGFVSAEELAAFYQLCDVFVLTPKQTESDAEGFGIVYLEAKKFKKPIIATRTGGVEEALKNYNQKQFISDLKTLTKAIKKIICLEK